MKKIYILLSSTGTFPARAVRLFTHCKYSHVSIALVPSLGKFYSYARRKIHNPLIGGLVEENTKCGIFGLYPDGKCQLLEMHVDDAVYDEVSKTLNFYLDNYDKCKYNFGAILPMALGIEQKLKFRMTCSQFVAHLLESTKACALPKHASIMRPSDFFKISNIKCVFNGKLKDLSFPQE